MWHESLYGRLLRVSGGALYLLSMTSVSMARAQAETAHPVVVELFTSQGCSSCPPANANLARISERANVLALSFGVTYWDRLGWKDSFAREDYTQRQATYESPLGESGPFTPQMVIDGSRSLVGSDLREVDQVIMAESTRQTRTAPSLSLTRDKVEIGAARDAMRQADVWLVLYDPRTVEVPVRRGENAGRTLPHKNVVHDLSHLGRWSGEPLSLPIKQTDGLRIAILLQVPNGGPILAAVSN